MRKLKYHERKLLKKVNLYNWKSDGNVREVAILRRYKLKDREEYIKYNKICGAIKKLSSKLKLLKENDQIRIKTTRELLLKLYNLGVINITNSLESCDKITASSFCRRRLPVILCKLHMCESLKQAITYIEQGHIMVGPNTIIDPAFLVTRSMEEYVGWTPGSKIKKHILSYNGEFDDFEFNEFSTSCQNFGYSNHN